MPDLLASAGSTRCPLEPERSSAESAPRRRALGAWLGRQTFALSLLARCLAGAADCFALLAGALLGGLLISPPALHLAKQAFALKLLFQDFEGLFDVVVSDEYLQGVLLCSSVSASQRAIVTDPGQIVSRTRNGACPARCCEPGEGVLLASPQMASMGLEPHLSASKGESSI
jgi:hypothetical protein